MLLASYDCLLALLILFPLFLGGVWIDRPGLHLELAQLGVPVIICALASLALGPARLRQSRVVRMAASVWKAWQEGLARAPVKVIAGASFAFGAIWTLVSLRRHWALGSGARDLAIFTGTFWNLTHGLGYTAAMKGWTNLFQDHQSPINFLMAPVFALSPRAETLLALQGFGLAAAGAAAYFLARARLPAKHWAVAAIPLVYWAYLPTRNAYAFDFHPETLMLPLFLAGIASFLRGWRVLGVFFFLLGLMGKESGGVVLSGIGLALLAQREPARDAPLAVGEPKLDASFAPIELKRRPRLGLALILGGAVLFVFQIRVVPALLHTPYAYNGEYASYGGKLSDLALSPVLHPLIFWSHLVAPSRLKFLFWTLGGLAFLPLLDWRTAIAAVPCYLMLFTTDGDHRVSLYYYYGIEASIGLFWALPGGILRAEDWLRKRSRPPIAVGFWMLFWALALFDRGEITRLRRYEATPHANWLRTELSPCIAGDEVAAPSALVPHLASRPWARDLPVDTAPTQGGVETPVACAVLDATIDHFPMSEDQTHELFRRLRGDPGYRVVYECGPTTVLERVGASPPRPWETAARKSSAEKAAAMAMAMAMGGKLSSSCLSCVPACPRL